MSSISPRELESLFPDIEPMEAVPIKLKRKPRIDYTEETCEETRSVERSEEILSDPVEPYIIKLKRKKTINIADFVEDIPSVYGTGLPIPYEDFRDFHLVRACELSFPWKFGSIDSPYGSIIYPIK
jgi:hypothetical protein